MSGLWSDRRVGDELVVQTFSLTRDSLVRYAGASGDFNPIHYRDDVAQSVGLEGVLAHGMLTMGLAIAPVTEWLSGRGYVSGYQVRFTKPIYVPAGASRSVTVSARLAKVNEPLEGQATISLSVTTDEGVSVLGKAFAVVSTW